VTEIPDELYEQIVDAMPIPCVDLLVRDESDRVLLVHRRNDPARNEWWFPGGRIHFFEDRRDAVTRKLREETGLTATDVKERGTYDLFFTVDPETRRHSITTLYEVVVAHPSGVTLDEQSGAACWLAPAEWLERDLPSFIRGRLQEWGS
jgi:colanic acid biosynthesis protein WcaH